MKRLKLSFNLLLTIRLFSEKIFLKVSKRIGGVELRTTLVSLKLFGQTKWNKATETKKVGLQLFLPHFLPAQRENKILPHSDNGQWTQWPPYLFSPLSPRTAFLAWRWLLPEKKEGNGVWDQQSTPSLSRISSGVLGL